MAMDPSSVATSDDLNSRVLTSTAWLPSPWWMWGIALAFLFFQFFIQLSSGVMLGQLIISFHTTPLGAGILAGSYYIVYLLLQTPAGMLVDRYGPRRLLTGGGFVCSVGALLFATSHSLLVAELGRILMGAGSAFAFVSTLYISAEWFPPSRFAIMVGLAESIGMFGTLLGNVFLAHSLRYVPWRETMMIACGVAMVIGFLCWVLVRDRHPQGTLSQIQSFTEFFSQVRRLLKNGGLWINGLYSSIIFSILTVFAGLWLVPYFQLVYGIPLTKATLVSSLLFIGISVGSPFIGWLYAYVPKPRWLLCGMAGMAACLCVWIILSPPSQLIFTGALMFVLGLLSSAYVINFAIVKDLVSANVMSTAIGFTNMLCVVSSPVLQPLVGWFIDLNSKMDPATAKPIYDLHSFHYALLTFPLLLCIAALLALMIPKPGIASK